VKTAQQESTQALKEGLFAANVWVARSNQTQVALDAPAALLVNTPTYWGQLAMPLAQIALGGRSHLREQLDVLHVPQERTRSIRAAQAQPTAWDVLLERLGPSRLLTALLPARLAPQARTPLPSALPPCRRVSCAQRARTPRRWAPPPPRLAAAAH